MRLARLRATDTVPLAQRHDSGCHEEDATLHCSHLCTVQRSDSYARNSFRLPRAPCSIDPLSRFDATCDESPSDGANLVGHLRGGPVDHVVGVPRHGDDRVTVDASCRKLERDRLADAG